MTPAAYAKVKEVFAKALQVPAEDRERFVRNACQDDETLREVLSLLRHHKDETVFDEPPQHTATIPTASKGNPQALTPAIIPAPRLEADSYVILSDVWEENRQILRRRLTIIAVVWARLMAFSSLRLFTYHYATLGYGTRVAAILISALCAWVLHRHRDLSLFQIRAVECVVVANVGLLAASIELRLMLEMAHLKDDATLISVNNWNDFTWTLIIFIYGVFMPNTWQRAAAVLLPAATIPTLLTAAANWINPDVYVLLEEDQFGQPLPTPLIAACVAIYAAHSIHGARISAFQARRLAQYKIKRLIGEGGMGQVFEAEHLLLKRDCAIKIIQPERCADADVLRRFEREVRATAKLTHPHTIEVYDYGQTKDGVFFFAMELLPGMNLRDLVATYGPLPSSRTVHFLTQVCEALVEAHGVGLIHRDIKPGNVFASQRGGIFDFAKLLDFGLVREMKVDPSQSIVSNMIAGTPAYMSPEQIESPTRVDARTDIYALGAVGYFLLTGRPPFTSDSPMEIMLAKINNEPAAPSTHQPAIPTDLDNVIMRCLASDVDKRIATAAQLKAELEQCRCSGGWTQENAAQWWQDNAIQ